MRVGEIASRSRATREPFDVVRTDLLPCYPQGNGFRDSGVKVGAMNVIGSLGGPASSLGDELTQLRVSCLGRGEQGDSISRLQSKLSADDQVQPCGFSGLMRSDDAGERAFICNGQCGIAQLFRSLYQLAW